MTHIIAEPCVGVKDKACVEVCPEDCIYDRDGWEALRIHPGECTDCGLCVDACPVEAIYPIAELPAKWSRWIDRNFGAFGLESPRRNETSPGEVFSDVRVAD